MLTQPLPTTSSQRLLRLLIVDDIAGVRRDLRLLLSLSGALQVVGEAANGVEALQQTEQLRPDVLLLDLEMPVMDGYAAARQIKACWPACRVVALSVHSYPAARQKAANAGVDDFVEKGAPLAEILQKIGLL